MGAFLRRHALVSQADLDDALDQQKHSSLQLGELLTKAQRVERAMIEKLLEEQQQVRSLVSAAEQELVLAVTRLGDLLHARGHVTREQLDLALDAQSKAGGRLGDILIESGHLSVQSLHDTLTHQTKLRAVLLATVASLILASGALSATAEAGSSDTARVTITLQILPPQPEILLGQQLDGQDFNATGASFMPDGAGGYIVQPLEFTPSGLPHQSMQFQIDEDAVAPRGVMNIYVEPR